MQVISRFAPSPTGRLHLGHAYSALLAHRFARERGGAFLLRIEDIDGTRSRPEHVAGILEDLAWLGLDWDGEPVFQSRRLPLYAAALERLKELGLVYPCFCTRSAIAAEIAASGAAPHGPDGPAYPGTCRGLSEAERGRRCAEEPHAWRLDVGKALAWLNNPLPLAGEEGPAASAVGGEGLAESTEKTLTPQAPPGSPLSRKRERKLGWNDHGLPIPATPEIFGDVVLARKDAPTSYHLAVTVDDAAQGITDIVRGRDLFAATHVHRLLQALLGLPTPAYHHHDLLLGPDGRRLAKRNNAPSLADLRAAGAEPEALRADLLSGRMPAGYSAATD